MDICEYENCFREFDTRVLTMKIEDIYKIWSCMYTPPETFPDAVRAALPFKDPKSVDYAKSSSGLAKMRISSMLMICLVPTRCFLWNKVSKAV